MHVSQCMPMIPGEVQRNRENMIALILSLCLVGNVFAAGEGSDLHNRYRFSRMLDKEGRYWLHWSFDSEAETISFAVNVETTGWVGFGLSPNGQMPQSDVVIGWVDGNGAPHFQVSW